jgi:hypothetical protein
MSKFLIQTKGTQQQEVEGSRFYFQDEFLWVVDSQECPVYVRDAKEISSVQLLN